MKPLNKWFEGHTRRTMYVMIFVLTINSLILGPILIKHKGRIMIDVGEDAFYEYSYEQLTGTYRKSKETKDYEKISEYVPPSKNEFFIMDGQAIFTTREDNIVKIDLDTLEEELVEYTLGSLSLRTYNSRFMVLTDASRDHNAVVMNIETLEIVDYIKKKILREEISEDYLVFEVLSERKKYRYRFETRILVDITEE